MKYILVLHENMQSKFVAYIKDLIIYSVFYYENITFYNLSMSS